MCKVVDPKMDKTPWDDISDSDIIPGYKTGEYTLQPWSQRLGYDDRRWRWNDKVIPQEGQMNSRNWKRQ